MAIILSGVVMKQFTEFLVRQDLIPKGVKARKSSKGLGRIYKGVFEALQKKYKDSALLSEVMYNLGREQSKEMIKELDIEKNLHGCAIALLATYSIFGLKAKIVKEEKDEIIIHTSWCPWCKIKGWNPAICASMDMYEIGLIKGINPKVLHIVTKRRSMGSKICEIILRKK